jgi:hypothetical protein
LGSFVDSKEHYGFVPGFSILPSLFDLILPFLLILKDITAYRTCYFRLFPLHFTQQLFWDSDPNSNRGIRLSFPAVST